MRELTLDLRTRVVTSDIKIWRLFPGVDYKFLSAFEEQSVVFLDFPGLPLPDGQVVESLSDLPERIMVARAVRGWAQDVRLAGIRGDKLPPEPSRIPADYAAQRQGCNLGIDKGAIAGLFSRPSSLTVS